VNGDHASAIKRQSWLRRARTSGSSSITRDLWALRKPASDSQMTHVCLRDRRLNEALADISTRIGASVGIPAADDIAIGHWPGMAAARARPLKRYPAIPERW